MPDVLDQSRIYPLDVFVVGLILGRPHGQNAQLQFFGYPRKESPNQFRTHLSYERTPGNFSQYTLQHLGNREEDHLDILRRLHTNLGSKPLFLEHLYYKPEEPVQKYWPDSRWHFFMPPAFSARSLSRQSQESKRWKVWDDWGGTSRYFTPDSTRLSDYFQWKDLRSDV